MRRTALIVAGGSGSRMGASIPKQFLPLCGKPVLLHTVEIFLQLKVDAIVLALPEAHIEMWEAVSQQYLSPSSQQQVHSCMGGATRSDSVHNGLEQLTGIVSEPENSLVAIHDGVRPLVPTSIIQSSYQQAAEQGASVVCVPVKASLRQSEGSLSRAVDRSLFWQVQTPQTFRLDQILACYRDRPSGTFTDDASLYEARGGQVHICKGSYDNLKLTTPEDMIVAERILERRK